jgi:hypothetical protein
LLKIIIQIKKKDENKLLVIVKLDCKRKMFTRPFKIYIHDLKINDFSLITIKEEDEKKSFL